MPQTIWYVVFFFKQKTAYDITVPYEKKANLTKLFGREHKKLYGYLSLDAVEVVNARVRVIIPTPKAKFVKKRLQASKSASPILSRRMSLMGSWQKVPVYDRENLVPGV